MQLINDTCIFCTLNLGDGHIVKTYQNVVQVDIIKEDKIYIVKTECLQCARFHVYIYNEDEFLSKLITPS